MHISLFIIIHVFFSIFREEIFEKPSSGASRDATKVLILITDGDPSDIDTITDKYNKQNVIRFVIGVGWDVLTGLLISFQFV